MGRGVGLLVGKGVGLSVVTSLHGHGSASHALTTSEYSPWSSTSNTNLESGPCLLMSRLILVTYRGGEALWTHIIEVVGGSHIHSTSPRLLFPQAWLDTLRGIPPCEIGTSTSVEA